MGNGLGFTVVRLIAGRVVAVRKDPWRFFVSSRPGGILGIRGPRVGRAQGFAQKPPGSCADGLSSPSGLPRGNELVNDNS
jgi:hypothetical protein